MPKKSLPRLSGTFKFIHPLSMRVFALLAQAQIAKGGDKPVGKQGLQKGPQKG